MESTAAMVGGGIILRSPGLSASGRPFLPSLTRHSLAAAASSSLGSFGPNSCRSFPENGKGPFQPITHLKSRSPRLRLVPCAAESTQSSSSVAIDKPTVPDNEFSLAKVRNLFYSPILSALYVFDILIEFIALSFHKSIYFLAEMKIFY